MAKLYDQHCASSSLDEKNDVAVKRIEKSDDCIIIHDDTLVVDLQDEPVKGIREVEQHPLDGEQKKPVWRGKLCHHFHFGRSKWYKNLSYI